MKDYRITSLIPSRKKADFFRKAETCATKKEVFELAKEIAKYYQVKYAWSAEQTKTVALSLYASGAARFEMKQADNAEDFLLHYITWKEKIALRLNDLGAFGDSIETACHLINRREHWRASVKALHVSAIGATDIQINGVKYEIGHNGKSFADSIEEDAMHGPFDGVIYGVFSEELKINICALFTGGKLNAALSLIAKNLYVFPDKYAFLSFMDSISAKSATIQWKEHIAMYQVIYNESKKRAFLKAIEKSGYNTLYDYMLSIGKNDYLTD